MKKIIQIPYGKKNYIKLKVPNNNLIGIFKPKKSEPIIAEKHAIQKALSKPIGVSPLKELAKGKKNATIAITDASRPNIERKILPIIIEHLESGGPTKDNIKIIVGSGAHWIPYKSELDEKLGFLKGRIEFICHNAFKSEMKYFGKTSFGYPIEINRLFAESDLKVILGTVLPHPFAGFSGGVKWFQ